MSRIRGFDSRIEVLVRKELDALGIVYEANVMTLPGRPDLVFAQSKLVVFVDGDFWHGYRYPLWKDRLSPYWQAKIERNRRRDPLNHAKLRRRGWQVLRLWAHQLDQDLPAVVWRILKALRMEHRGSTSCDPRLAPRSATKRSSLAPRRAAARR